MLTIKSASNGYILQTDDGDLNNLPVVVAEDDGAILGDVDAAAQMLREVLELIGPSTSRHAEKRIRVITMPGDKFTGQLSLAYQEQLKSLRDELNDVLEDGNGTQG